MGKIVIQSQVLRPSEVVELQQVWDIMDEEEVEELSISQAIAYLCGFTMPSDGKNSKHKSIVDYGMNKANKPATRSILFGDGRSVQVEDSGNSTYGLIAFKEDAGILKKSDFDELRDTILEKDKPTTHVFIQAPVAMKPARATEATAKKAERRMTFDYTSNVGLVPLVNDPIDMIATLLHKETLEPLTDAEGNPLQFYVPGKVLTKCYAHALGGDVKPSALNRFSKYGDLFKIQTPCEVLYFDMGIQMCFQKEPVDNVSNQVIFEEIDKGYVIEEKRAMPCYLVYDHSTNQVKPYSKEIFDQAFHIMEMDRFMITPKGLYRRQSMLQAYQTDDSVPPSPHSPRDSRLQLSLTRSNSCTLSQFSLLGGRTRCNNPILEKELAKVKAILNQSDTFILQFLVLGLNYARRTSSNPTQMLDVTAFVKVFEKLKQEQLYNRFNARLVPLLAIFFPLLGFPSSLRDKLFGYCRFRSVLLVPVWGRPSRSDYAAYIFGTCLYGSQIVSLWNVIGDKSEFRLQDIIASWIFLVIFIFVLVPCMLLSLSSVWTKGVKKLSLSKFVVTLPPLLSLPDGSHKININSDGSINNDGFVLSKSKYETKKSFLTAYDYYRDTVKKAYSLVNNLLVFQILRAGFLSLAVTLTYFLLYLDRITQKYNSSNNAVFGSFNIIGILLTCCCIFGAFEIAYRELLIHSEKVRAFAVSRNVNKEAIDFLWPENVIAWRHVQRTIALEKNNFVDISISFSYLLGMCFFVASFVSCIVAEDAKEPEIFYFVTGLCASMYGIVTLKQGIKSNFYMRELQRTLQEEEAKIVTESPVLGQDNLPFDPRPPDLSAVHLPKFVEDLIHRLAENAHDVWSKRKLQDGWVYGEKNDVQGKRHTDLIPYKFLSCVTQSYDYLMVQETTKALYAMGYRVRRLEWDTKSIAKGSSKTMIMPLDKDGKVVTLPNGYIPAPVETCVDDMPEDLIELNEALATHVHHKWARSRMDQGYLYGDQRCDDIDAPGGLRHPFLKKFEDLDDETKEANRNASSEILKTMSALGFKIVRMHTTTSSLLLPLHQRRTAALRNIKSLQPIVESRYYHLCGFEIDNVRWWIAFISVVLNAIVVIIVLSLQ